jgi:hypothetical protein
VPLPEEEEEERPLPADVEEDDDEETEAHPALPPPVDEEEEKEEEEEATKVPAKKRRRRDQCVYYLEASKKTRCKNDGVHLVQNKGKAAAYYCEEHRCKCTLGDRPRRKKDGRPHCGRCKSQGLDKRQQQQPVATLAEALEEPAPGMEQWLGDDGQPLH